MKKLLTSDVEVQEQNGGLHHQLEGPNKGFFGQITLGLQTLFDLRRALVAVVTGELANTAGALEEDGVPKCLGEDKHEYKECETADPQEFPDGPTPAFLLSGKSTLLKSLV